MFAVVENIKRLPKSKTMELVLITHIFFSQ